MFSFRFDPRADFNLSFHLNFVWFRQWLHCSRKLNDFMQPESLEVSNIFIFPEHRLLPAFSVNLETSYM